MCLPSVRPCVIEDESGSKSNVLYAALGAKWPIWRDCTGTPAEGSAESGRQRGKRHTPFVRPLKVRMVGD